MLANLGEFRQSNVPQGVADYVTNQLDSIKKLMLSYDECSDFHSFPIKKEKMMKYKNITIHKHRTASTYYTRFRMNDKQHHITGKTQQECLENLKKRYQEELVKKYQRKVNPTSKMPLLEWVYNWLKTYKENSVRETTFKGISYLIKNHFKGKLFEMPICDVLPIHILEFINNLEKPKVKENAYVYLKDIFSKAYDNRLVDRNPMQSMKKPKHTAQEKRALTLEEQSQFEYACKQDDRYTLLLVALWQGLRLGELRALERADFDFDNNILRISKSESDNDDMETKNVYSDRTMPLFPETQELVKEYLANHNEKRPFYHTKNYISKVLNEILDKLNISDITMHSLRHTFITRCQEKNVQLYIIQKWVGHVKGSAVTLKTYTHLQDEAETNAIKQLVSA